MQSTYIRDIMQQFEEVTTIPTITPQGTKIGNPQQAKRILEAVDEGMVEILSRIRENKKAYEKGKETARKQARTTYNFLSLNSSTPNKNSGTTENRQQPPERTTHFNPNTIH